MIAMHIEVMHCLLFSDCLLHIWLFNDLCYVTMESVSVSATCKDMEMKFSSFQAFVTGRTRPFHNGRNGDVTRGPRLTKPFPLSGS